MLFSTLTSNNTEIGHINFPLLRLIVEDRDWRRTIKLKFVYKDYMRRRGDVSAI